ncbi:MFS general substrate transporter [Vararia minispora EC-137]|uniref:MFS general substrate transporter n=1 Tax=Vararia minispora EC-137 TaxID=1314806 RepID=A0ACB8QJ15_9AGAM|nr:MFS general substrate transporter [Vararia minispora EC-137]
MYTPHSARIERTPPAVVPRSGPKSASSTGTASVSAELARKWLQLDELDGMRIRTPSVEWAANDPENPVFFSKWKKWAITLTGCYLTIIVTAASSSYATGFTSMVADLQSNFYLAGVGISVYALGFGVVPIFAAPISEEIGRRPLFIGAATVLVIAHIMIGAARNMATVLVGRFLVGSAGSMAAMVGGSIADIWQVHERGIPLALFSFSAIGGTGIGPVASGWIEMDSRFQWRWIQWFHLIAAGLCLLFIIAFMTETRSSVLLTRRARSLRKDTSDSRYKSKAEIDMPNLKTLLYISITRTPHILFTEPIVLSISGWIGLAWGILFGIIESIAPAFKSAHGFTIGQAGTVYLALVIGALLGVVSCFHQEHLYQGGVKKRGPEARLYWPMVAGLIFPAGMLIYAWTTFPKVPWIAMTTGLTLFMWATFQIFNASYAYIADCYGSYASSAIAGLNLFRNLVATAFPLFTTQYFEALGYNWGNTILGIVALVLAPIPFVLFIYGPRIRAASPVSKRLTRAK